MYVCAQMYINIIFDWCEPLLTLKPHMYVK